MCYITRLLVLFFLVTLVLSKTTPPKPDKLKTDKPKTDKPKTENPKTDNCGCPERTLHLPICASDGKTYKSICEFICRRKFDSKKKDYKEDKQLKFKFYGKCG